MESPLPPPSGGIAANEEEWVESPGMTVSASLHAVRFLRDFAEDGDTIADLKLCAIERKWGGFVVDSDVAVYFYAERSSVLGDNAIPSSLTTSSTLYLAPSSLSADPTEDDKRLSTVEVQLGIERTGYMLRMKRGAMGRKGRWVRRFFVLTTRGLHRFERSRSGQTLFGIEKEDIKSVEDAKAKYGGQCWTMERTDKTRAIFSTTDIVERNGWVTALNRLMAEAKKRAGHGRKLHHRQTVDGFVNDRHAPDGMKLGARTDDEDDGAGPPMLGSAIAGRRSIYHGAHEVAKPPMTPKGAGPDQLAAEAGGGGGGAAGGGGGGGGKALPAFNFDRKSLGLRPPRGMGTMGRDSHDWGSLAGGSLVAAGSRHNDSLSTPGRPPSWSDFTARSQRGVSSTFSVGSLALANRRPIVALAVGGVVVRRAANWGDAIELGPLTRGGVHSGKVELFLADGGDPVIISRKELKGLMKSSTGWRTGATARYPLGGSRRGAFLELIPSLGSAAPGSAAALIGMMTPTPSSPDAQSSSSSKDAAKPNVAMAILLALPGSIFVALALPIVLDTPSFHGKMFAVGVGSVLLLTALFPVLAALSGAMGGASKADKERLKRSSMASKVYGITPLRLDGGAHRQSGSSDIDFDPTRRSRAFSGGARSVPDWPHGTMPPAIASKFFDAVSDTSVGELATQLIEACPEADKLYRAYYLKILLSQPYSKAKPAGSEARPVSYCLKKLTKLMKWRGDYGNTAIVASSLRNDYAKYFYFRGFDSTGAPIAWFRASVMPWGDINIDAFVKAVVFQIDSAVRDFMPRGTEGFTCVIDATGIGGSQVFSIARLLKKLADIFVNGFPDRLASLFVTPCTKVIKTIYGMIKGALPASITKKVKLLDDMETHDKLVEAVGGISNVHFLAAALLPDEEDAFEEDDSLTVEQTINRQMELYKETYGGRDVQYGEFDEFEMVAPPGGGKGGAAGGGAAGGAAAASAAQPDEVAPLSPLRDGDGDGDDEAEE